MHVVSYFILKKPHKGADGHHRQHARLVAAYLQSQSQGCNLGQHDFQNFTRSGNLTLTLVWVKLTSTYAIRVVLPGCPTT